MAKYYVSEGKALTTKKGLKGAGSELTTAMVEGGEDKLKALVKAGLVTSKEEIKAKTEAKVSKK